MAAAADAGSVATAVSVTCRTPQAHFAGCPGEAPAPWFDADQVRGTTRASDPEPSTKTFWPWYRLGFTGCVIVTRTPLARRTKICCAACGLSKYCFCA